MTYYIKKVSAQAEQKSKNSDSEKKNTKTTQLQLDYADNSTKKILKTPIMNKHQKLFLAGSRFQHSSDSFIHQHGRESHKNEITRKKHTHIDVRKNTHFCALEVHVERKKTHTLIQHIK